MSVKTLHIHKKKRKLLSDYFYRTDIRMYYAVNFIFHGFIRKTELCEIQVSQIDWNSEMIRMNSAETKNRIQDSVTIPRDLKKIMLSMGLDQLPPYFYIFGHNLLSGEKQCTRPDTLSDRHKELKDALIAEMEQRNLPCTLRSDDGKAFYSWKHSGVVAYYTATKDVYAIMKQCRHHDLKVTMIYLKSLGLMPNEAVGTANVTI